MIFRLLIGTILIGIILLFVIGFEVRQIKKLKISDKEINNCFKEVGKWKF